MAPRKASGCGIVFLIVLNWLAILQCNASPPEKRSSTPVGFSSIHTFLPQVPYKPTEVYFPSLHYVFDLLNVVREGEYPPELMASKINLINYIQNANVETQSALVNIPDLSHLHPRDQLVGVLLRLQKDLPMHCLVKADVSKLILYNMMKSYLSNVPVLDGMFPQNFAMYSSPYSDNTDYRMIIKQLLNKLRCCEKKHMVIPAPEIKTEIKYIEKPCPTPTVPAETTVVITEPPYQKYIPLLPTPSNGFEQMKYKIVKDFLDREDLQGVLGDVDMTHAQTDDERLKIILQKSAQIHNLDQPVVDAIKFYLNYVTNMSSLHLYTQKEIRKQFDLTQIFTDTLDFENLSTEGKLAFDSFYSFLLNVTGKQMKGFDTWIDVKTKGKFMQVMFTYFLESEFTPEPVKQAITFLQPLIKMDGLGATAP